MKPLNIYLSRKDKKELNELRMKYHISFSTIADILGYHFLTLFTNEEIEESYIHNGKEEIKTSIKPRKRYEINKPSVFYTNVLLMYLRKETKYYLEKCNRYDEKKYAKVMNKITTDMKNTYEENWNGNLITRSFVRFIKKNPDYVKRKLNEA